MESALLVTFVLAGLMLVPVALVLGSITYANLAQQGETQRRDGYQTMATLTVDAPSISPSIRGEALSDHSLVHARWRLPDGTTSSGQVMAKEGLAAGDRVPVWLDHAGRPMKEPVTPTQAGVAGVVVALAGWLTGVGLLALGFLAMRRMLDRRRLDTWQREWTRVEPGWRDQWRDERA